jgi:hypothetical protein
VDGRLDNIIKLVLCFQIEVSFLMVGHTHEAVDRYFSYINRALTGLGNTMTTDEMEKVVKEYLADGKTMDVHDLEYVADWKDWSKGGCSEEMHDHTGKGSALHFRFQRDE